MTPKHNSINRARLANVLDVLADLLTEPLRPIAAAALVFCVEELTLMTTPTDAPAPAATSTPAPAATEGANKTEHAPTAPTKAELRARALKAAATRKANKTKATTTAKSDGTAGSEPAASVENGSRN
jgi:hypothetical protein